MNSNNNTMNFTEKNNDDRTKRYFRFLHRNAFEIIF